MENNKIVLTVNGEDVEYRVLLNIEDVNGKNYVVYTNDEIKENGDVLSYVAEYVENKDTGNVKLISIKDDKEWEFIRDIVNSIQNEEEV
jgi:uncharacterized protein YrzB (UPF0473 family)